MSQIRILVVEDNALHFSKIELLLEEMKYEMVGHAKSGKETLRLIKASEPDLILMDIQILGEDNGISLAKKLNETEDIPIIFTTSFKDQETIREAIESGPFAYLTKPINRAELQASIELAIHKLTQEAVIKPHESVPDNKGFLSSASIFVKQIDRIVKVTYDEILWIGSADEEKYLHIHTAEEILRIRSSIKKMMEKLPSFFMRINSSQLINVKHITNIDDSRNLISTGDLRFSVSRKFKKELMAKLTFLN